MLFIAVAAAMIAAILLQYFLYKKHGFSGLEYDVDLSDGEVYEGDDVYLYEELTNNSRLPLPYLKVDTDLPEGLVFTLLEETRDAPPKRRSRRRGPAVSASLSGEEIPDAPGVRRARHTGSIQSLFVLRPYAHIRRRWRVTCKKRGEYTLGGVLVTGNDILGMNARSARLEPAGRGKNRITVLPVPEELEGRFASSRTLCGDAISDACPVTDPVRICSSREYTPLDPMNRINWKSTAAHGKLMVNIEEKTVRHRFSLLLNMNSREIERFPDTPSDPAAIERCVKICASLLDRLAAEDVPVRLFANYPPDGVQGAEAVSSDPSGSGICVCGPYRGRRDMIFALRTLAGLEMKISLPADKMFDHIAAHPELYRESENLILVSSYLDGRMMNLRRALEAEGIRVIIYVATSRNVVGQLPDDADVYFSL